MALHLAVPNGNPWPKSWGIQVPVLNNNVPNVPPSKYQKTLKFAYNRDIRSFQKYYNKNISEVVCSGIPLPRSLSARCKLVTKLELYEHSQVRSKFYNLRSLKLGGLPQKKGCVKFVKGLIHHNKSLKEVWLDRYETMRVLSYDLKFPRQLGSFSLGLFDCPKEQMSKKLQFLKRYRNLKQIALCSTEPRQPQPRAIDVEAQSFLTFLESIFKKNSLKGIKLDLMDPKVAERSNMLNDFLLKKISQNDLESFDLRLTLTQVPQLDKTAKKILEQLDYFALSLDGAPLQRNSSIWTEESLHNQYNRHRSFMINFKGLAEIDLNPILSSISPSLKVLDLSFNNDQCSFGLNWSDIISRFESLESLSLSFTNCSGVLAFCLASLSSCADNLKSLKSIAVKFQNVNFTPEIYDTIDQFYTAIQHVPRHTFNLEAPSAKDIQLHTLCNSLHRLNDLRGLKLMIHLGAVESIQCIGDLIESQEVLERLDLHVRLEMYNTMPFNLPLEKLSKLEYLRIELLFRPENQFVSQLNSSIARLEALQHLELSILCYSKISYSVFQSLLARLNLLRGLKELEMSVNVEDESANETLPQKNLKLKKELQSLLSHHPSLTKIMFHHFVSIICCTR